MKLMLLWCMCIAFLACTPTPSPTPTTDAAVTHAKASKPYGRHVPFPKTRHVPDSSKLGAGITRPPIIPTSWTQPAWFIDPAHGNDASNTCITSGSPCKTWAEVMARFGTNEPRLRQNTTFTFLSSQTDNTDPVVFHPRSENGSLIVIQGLLNASTKVASGTLGSVTAKNRSTPQLLQADIGASGAVGQLLVNNNIAHPARSWVYANVSGTVFSLTQPLVAVSPPSAVPSAPAEVDTYANTDAFTLYAPTQVNIVDVGVTLADYDLAGDNGLVIYNLTVFDPNVAGDPSFLGNANVTVIESLYQRYLEFSESISNDVTSALVNVSVPFGMFGGKRSSMSDEATPLIVYGGNIGSPLGNFANLFGTWLDGDVYLNGIASNAVLMQGGNIGLVYVDTSTTLEVEMGARMTDNAYGSNILWGPGGIDLHPSSALQYTAPATGTFVLTGGIKLATETTGYSVTSSGTWAGGITLTVAHLDAAAGASGFGGSAIDPQSGAVITTHAIP